MSEDWYHHETKEHADTRKDEVCPYLPEKNTSELFQVQTEPRMKQYLQSRDLSEEVAKRNGWYLASLANALRIVIPAYSRIPDHHYWTARAIDPHIKKRYDCPSAPRHDAVVLMYPIESKGHHVFVVEGPMDALAVASCGYMSIALMGNMPGEKVLNTVAALVKGRHVFLFPDSDGIIQMMGVQGFLAKQGVYVAIHSMNGDKDFASMRHVNRVALIQEIIQEDQ